jgi:putative transcriptional regulator
MGAPRHHFGEELLLDYAAGTAREALALPVGVHLAFCRECGERLRAIERLALAAIGARPVAAPAAVVRRRLLGALAAAPTPLARPLRRPDLRLAALGLPQVLGRYLPEGALRWKRALPGLESMRLRLDDPLARARLLRCSPGYQVPHHDHGGPEHTVVLQGSFVDDGERFGPGDVCERLPGQRHRPRVDDGASGVALVVNRGGLVPLTLLGRMLQLLCPR